MTSQKIAIGFVAVALFVGSMTAHAADFSAGVKAYRHGDYATALRIFRQLADQGHTLAHLHLGTMYLNGNGVTRDYTVAVRWFRKAADQGNALARTNLGNMYLKGWGVTQDYTVAVRWHRKAADQGEALAQANLGFMYEDGTGVIQDYLQALMWYNIAAARGDKIARKRRDRLAEKMTPAQVAEAQRLARKWKPKR